MKFDHKKWRNDPVKPQWRIQKNFNDKGKVLGYTIYCPRCSEKVLEYLENSRLFPCDVDHCGITDRFYVGQVLFKTDTKEGIILKKIKDRPEDIPF